MTQTNETWPSIEALQRPDAVRHHLGELDAEELSARVKVVVA